MKIRRIFLHLFIESLYLISCGLVTIILVISFGALEWWGMTLCVISAYIVMSLIRNLEWRKILLQNESQGRTVIVTEFVIYFVLVEAFFVFAYPLSSVLPNVFLENTNIVKIIDKKVCDLGTIVESTKSIIRKLN